MIAIIVLVSAVALPAVLPALNSRQSREAARLLQGALAGARDQAIHDGAPSGLRLLPDPAYPIIYLNGQADPSQILAYNRIVPIGPAPEYSEGAVSIFPGANYAALTALPCLVLEQAIADARGLPNSPTSWWWNIRVGDRVQVGNAGPWYTVCGPMVVLPGAGNPEGFVNAGAPGTASTWPAAGVPGNPTVEFLFLVNGRDDGPTIAAAGTGGPDGWVDSGFDGVDNDRNLNPGVDGPTEWEVERWIGAAANGVVSSPYAIRRRASPIAGARELSLPASVVIDATSWGTSRERSRLPINPLSGYVEILLNPDGTVVPAPFYGAPSSAGMDQAFLHFWLAERSDLATVDGNPQRTAPPFLPVPPGVIPAGMPAFPGNALLKGRYAVVTLFGRTGQVTVSEDPPFLFSSSLGYNAQRGAYNASNPFIPAEQGAR